MKQETQSAPKSQWLTVLEAAEYAKVSRARIDSAIHSGELRCAKLGPATRRIQTAEVDRWLLSNVKKGNK